MRLEVLSVMVNQRWRLRPAKLGFALPAAKAIMPELADNDVL